MNGAGVDKKGDRRGTMARRRPGIRFPLDQMGRFDEMNRVLSLAAHRPRSRLEGVEIGTTADYAARSAPILVAYACGETAEGWPSWRDRGCSLLDGCLPPPRS